MKRLIDYFIAHTAYVNIFTLIITVIGLTSLYFTKRDLHPPFKFNVIVVSAVLESASSEEVERLLTYPIEEVLRTVPGYEEINSYSRTGFMRIRIKFPQSEKNLSQKIEMIRGRIQVALRDLPPEVRDVNVVQSEDNQIFLANIGVIGADPHNPQHHSFIEQLKNKMSGVSGVSNVSTSLAPLHVFVRFDPAKLASYGITVAQLRSQIRSELDPRPIGFNSLNGREWLLEFASGDMSPEAVGQIPLFHNSLGKKLLLKDVAQIEYDFERNDNYRFLLNGEEAVEINVNKSPESDSINVFASLQETLKNIKPPDNIKLKILYDGPYFINQQIDVLLSNGFGGLLLVLAMLTWAMSFKTSLMTALGLPISYFGTFIVLKYLGMSIDLISMIAMILVVGNLVDDAVIFAERYNQLLAEGFSPEESASKAANELIVPVSGTILTIICAFIPILLLESEMSVIFGAIPIVVATALLLSWLETFFILPNHLAHYVKTPPHERSLAFFNRMARIYKKILRHTLHWRYLYGIASIAFLVFSLIIASKMPQDFSININAPQVEIFAIFKEEKDYDEVRETLKPLTSQLLAKTQKDIDFIETNMGFIWRDGKSYRGPKYATLRLVLNREETDTKKMKAEVLKIVQKELALFKHENIKEITAIESQRGSGARRTNMTSIELVGRDELAFKNAKKELIEQVANKGLIEDYIPPDNHGPLTYQFLPLPDAIKMHGLTKSELAFQIQSQTGSVELLRGRERGRWLKVMLEPQEMREPNEEDLKKIKIQSPRHGEALPLKYLGAWNKVGYSDGINHKMGERNLVLDFRFDGKKTNEQVVQAELKKIIKPILTKYPSLEIRVIDANEEDKKGREWTRNVIYLAGLLIFLILSAALGSFTQPLIVGLPIPFALIGVIWALKLHDLPLSLMSMIGLIGTMGVAVNDSIVMVDHINRLWREAGKKTTELVIDGAASRLRAISLTASCTLVGVFPTAYGIGGESGFTQPLAFSMGWGLLTSLLLTLFIIPAMLMTLEDLRGLFAKIKRKVRPSQKKSETLPTTPKPQPLLEV
jgi:multidrug efflux pump subunit AcrB